MFTWDFGEYNLSWWDVLLDPLQVSSTLSKQLLKVYSYQCFIAQNEQECTKLKQIIEKLILVQNRKAWMISYFIPFWQSKMIFLSGEFTWYYQLTWLCGLYHDEFEVQWNRLVMEEYAIVFTQLSDNFLHELESSTTGWLDLQINVLWSYMYSKQLLGYYSSMYNQNLLMQLLLHIDYYRSFVMWILRIKNDALLLYPVADMLLNSTSIDIDRRDLMRKDYEKIQKLCQEIGASR